MPGLADFLATAGRGRTIGNVGAAFGGQTPEQRGLADFIDNELPKYAQSIEATTDPRELEKIGLQFMGAAAKSGMPVQAMEKVMDLLIEPARKGLNVKQAGDVYGQLANELSPQTEPLTPRAPDPMQGQQLPSTTGFEPRTTPGREMNAGDAWRAAETEARTGVKIPANLAELVRSPSIIGQNTAQAANQNALAAHRKSEQNLKDEQLAALQRQPNTQIGNTGMTYRDVGLGSGGTALGTIARGAQPGPLHEANERLIQARTGAAGAAAGASGASASLARAREQDIRANPRGGAGGSVTETITDLTPDAIDIELIMKKAQEAGVDTPEGLAQFAARYGYEVEGTPEITPGTKVAGFNVTSPKIGGAFSLKPKPKTSTRTTSKPGGAAPTSGGKPLDDATAAQIFEKAGRDPKKAAAMAKQMGFRVD